MKSIVVRKKNRRIIISLLLAVTLIFTSVSFSFANEVDTSETEICSINGDLYQDLDDVDIDELADDISVLEAIGFDEDNIIGVITGNDIEVTDAVIATEESAGGTVETEQCNTFSYQTTDDVVSEITVVDETDDGGVVINISEGDLNDVLYFDDNGDLYLDGNKVEYSSTVEASESDTLIPNSYTLYGWSGIAIPPTKSSDYTILQTTYTNNNVKFGKKVRDITLSALISIFTAAFTGPLGIISGFVLNPIVSEFKTFANRIAPNAEVASFNIKVYGTNKSTTSATYTKYTGSIYMYKNCSGVSDSVIMYKKATRIAK
jgi:hypothetical protein